MTAAVRSINSLYFDIRGDDALFRRIRRDVLAISLTLGLGMPFLPVHEQQRELIQEIPPQVVKFLLEQKKPVEKKKPPVVVKPKVEPVKTAAKQPAVKPQASEKPKETARQKAQRSGLLAMADELSSLRDPSTIKTLSQRQSLSSRGKQAAVNDRAILTSGIAQGSGGIQTASLSRDTGGTLLEGRGTTMVDAPIDELGLGGGGAGHGSASAGRSIEEIQIVFDRNKSAVYTLYQRALRKDPSLQGKVVLELTIAPSGAVTACRIISSELKTASLEHRLLKRIREFNFGAKNVSEMVITYPIDFLPA